MILRAPDPQEAPALTDLVMRSKASWGYDAAFMEACRDVLTVRPESWEVPQVAVDGDLVGYVELHPSDCTLNHLFIDPKAQHRGVGSALLSWAVDRARAEGLPHLTLAADPNAEGFYHRHGWTITGSTPSEVDNVRPLAVMTLTL